MLHHSRKTRLVAGFFCFLLLVSGCSSLPINQLDSTLPSQVELEQTPFFPQQRYQCGPAALAMMLNFHDIAVTPDGLTPQVYLPERQGSLQIELTAAARKQGMLVYQLEPDLNHLLQEVAAGNPVLVLQNLAFVWLPNWHYAVVIGYNLEQETILLRSGTERRRVTTFANFMQTWARGDNWALVITPADRIPLTAQPLPYLKAAFDLEQTGQKKPAQIAYRTATRQWPDDTRTWLGLGNVSFSLAELNQAEKAFLQALSLDAGNTLTWNNLAYVYLQMGCLAEAQHAIDQALRLNPEDENLLDSKQEISQQVMGKPLVECNENE